MHDWTKLITVLILIHGLLSFLADVYGFFYPSGKLIWLSDNNCRSRPTDHMLFLSYMVGEH